MLEGRHVGHLLELLVDGYSLHVDILKVPHHGSDNNVTEGFFRTITADHYVFSGDGEHGNPERNTMEMLFDARAADEFTVYLTYDVEDIDEERKRERKKDGKTWVDRTHSLEAFFQSRRDRQDFKVVEGNGQTPQRVDLLQELDV